MEIKVIGMGCKQCDSLYDNTCKALKALNIDVVPEKIEDLVEIVSLGIMSAPSLMINDKLVIQGRSAKQSEIEKILKNYQ